MKSPIAFRPRDKNYEIPPKWWFPLVKILTAYGIEIDGYTFHPVKFDDESLLVKYGEAVVAVHRDIFVAWFRETIEGQDTRPVPRAPTAAEIREAEQQVEVERANGVAVESE